MNVIDLANDHPVGDIQQLSPSVILPNASDCERLYENYSILVARVMVNKLDFFGKYFKNVVPTHILHRYSD